PHARHCSEVERHEVEEERAITIGGDRGEITSVALRSLLVDDLEVGGLATHAWTVEHDLAVDFLQGEVDLNHLSFTLLPERSKSVSVRLPVVPAMGPECHRRCPATA